MASMVARVAHHASARSASLAARSRGNACKDLILVGSRANLAVRPQGKLSGDVPPKRPIRMFGCAHHDARRRYTTHSSFDFKSLHQVDRVAEFVAEEKDMESDHEALWALYHRWCKHFKIERDHDSMIRQFPRFKSCVFQVHQVNRAGLSYTLAINEKADTPCPSKNRKRHDEASAGFKSRVEFS